MKKVNILGFNEYVKQSHPEEFDVFLKEYANYNNWLNQTFLQLGHVYKTNNYSRKERVFVLNGFKPILDVDSYKFSRTYLVHFSNYKKDCYGENDEPGWINLDQAYKMMLVDITNEKDAFGNVIKKVDCDNNLYCEHQFRVLKRTDDELEVIYTNFKHHSYIDRSYSDKKYYNRHFCDIVYQKFSYEKDESGDWVRSISTYKNQIRLAADNSMGWCHDSDISGRNRYDGCFKNLRECKKKFLGVESLAKLPILFNYINTLSTDMFVPYPIKSTEW